MEACSIFIVPHSTLPHREGESERRSSARPPSECHVHVVDECVVYSSVMNSPSTRR